MSIQYQLDIEPNCVRLICQGRYSKKAALKLFDEALEVAAEHGRKAALVDVSALKGAPPDLLERFELGVEFAQIQKSKERIIAMVVVGEEPMIDRRRFGETVARNRGAVGRVFTDHDHAVAWLENQLHPEHAP